MGLKLAILERVLDRNLSKPVLRHFSNRSLPFLKNLSWSFFNPFFLLIRKNGSQERPQYLRSIHWLAFSEVLELSIASVLYYKVLWL